MSLAELSFCSIFNDLMKRNAKFATHMHGLAFHVKDELCMWLFPWKLCGFLFMFLTTLLHVLSHFVFHYWPPTSSLWTLEIWFYLLREGSLNKHLLMDHLAHSGRADRLGELLYDFSIIKQPYSDCWLSNSDPWPLLSQSCSFGSVSILWP